MMSRFKKADEDAERAAAAKAGKPDGALLLVCEARPYLRVRVMRAEMAEGVLVKEMSEATVLSKLEKDEVGNSLGAIAERLCDGHGRPRPSPRTPLGR